MRSVLVIIIFAAVLSGCDSNRVFEDNKDFDKKAWIVNDTANFEFTIDDEAVSYNLQCNIRNTIDYPYSRIFVNYWLEDSTHRVLSAKMVSSYLFDARTGEPNGNSGLGDIYDHRFPLIENTKFKAGKYFVKLQQYMRTDTLQGVLAAGVRIERVESR
jgi:gliding motility-associated lipoprotein GldH